MKHTNVLLAEMLDASIRENRVIRTAESIPLSADLADASEGFVTDAEEEEYWGTWEDEHGVKHAWRIHLVRDSQRRGWW